MRFNKVNIDSGISWKIQFVLKLLRCTDLNTHPFEIQAILTNNILSLKDQDWNII